MYIYIYIWICIDTIDVIREYRDDIIWRFPKMRVPPNGWFIRRNPIKMDDLGLPLFQETSIKGI